MNEIFLIGKIIEEIEYKFMLEKGKNAKSVIKLELLDKTKVEVVAYNEQADYALQILKIYEIVFIHAQILSNEVVVIEFDKM